MVTNEKNARLVSVLSYFLVGLIWYVVDSGVRNKVTKFHVKQVLNLCIFNFVISYLVGLFSLSFISVAVSLVFLVFWIVGLVNAFSLNQNNILLIGDFAEKYLTF